MDSHFGVHLVYLVLSLTIIQGIHAIQYSVKYLAHGEGGRRFRDEIGDAVAISIMEEATNFIWDQVLEQLSPNERKDVRNIVLIINTREIDSSHYKYNDHHYFIELGATSIKKCPADHLREQITRLIYFEMANILQWATDHDQEIMTSIAHFVVLKANYQLSIEAEYGGGDKWNASPDVTAQFLVYCNNRKPGFVAFLNKKMHKSSFSERYFQEF